MIFNPYGQRTSLPHHGQYFGRMNLKFLGHSLLLWKRNRVIS